jgi:DNA-binding LacI/PurR family transcriptional regulator
MSSFIAPLDIPKRLSLSAQAAMSIRKGITEGTWVNFLPSERRLCDILQVSRPTIRNALHLLAKEGLLDIRQGRRNRILTTTGKSPSSQSRLVGLITHVPLSRMNLPTYQGVSEMRTHLAEQGFSTLIFVCPSGSNRSQLRKLEEFIKQNSVFCCVLLSVSLEVQKWFSSHTLPALVLGSCHPEVNLPSLDVDQHSVCRHAAGIFLSKEHRRIALLVPDSGAAGDLASEAGFREAVAKHTGGGIPPMAIVIRHNGTAQNICAKLDVQFNSSQPPTALLVAKPQFVFAVIIYLLKRGLSVPDTISFISRDHDHVFENVSPPISHYTFGDETYAHRLSRLILQLVNQGNIASEANLIFPKYFTGGTVTKWDAALQF